MATTPDRAPRPTLAGPGSRRARRIATPTSIALVFTGAAASGAIAGPDPAADTVVAYIPGTSVPFGFDDPTAALGLPARDSGAGIDPGVVSPFQPAFTPAELVAVGRGGTLIVAFDEPVTDDPDNPFGVDLLVFGNPFFIDLAPPSGIAGGLFSEGGTIEVSVDGVRWHLVPDAPADGHWPTLGWLDAGPYDTDPGRVPSDPTRPVDPAFAPTEMVGAAWPELLAAYDGSAGGTPVDLGALGLSAISFVRIHQPADAPTAIEIDAVVDVAAVAEPTPADVDGDGLVGFGDLLAVLAAWGPCPSPPDICRADVDGNETVDFSDVLAVLAAWTAP